MDAQAFDIVIVGGGSAGCALAGRLSEDPALRVALVEAGPSDATRWVTVPAGLVGTVATKRLNWAFETEPQPGLGGRRGYQPRGKVLGGSSSINAMVYIRGHASDYDDWATAGCPGWAFDDVLPCFKRSEGCLVPGLDARWHGLDGPLKVSAPVSPSNFNRHFLDAAVECGHRLNPDFNGAEQDGVGLFHLTQQGGERCNAARAYLAPARQRPNLQVLTSAQARRIVFDGDRACGVEIEQAGSVRTLAARAEVVVAAGAFGSPQLLMLSGIGDGAALQALGIATRVHRPAVGANLQDHPDCLIARRESDLRLFGNSLPGLWQLWQAWRLYQRERRGLLTTNFAESGGFLRTRPSLPRPDVQWHFVIAMVDDHGRRRHRGHGFSLHACVLRPRSRGTVRLASPDPLAAPLIDPGFLSHLDDVATLMRAYRATRALLDTQALAPHAGRPLHGEPAPDDDAAVERFVRARCDTIYHPVGSCRMGSDDDAVLDPQLRVRGVRALRVVDASVMPTLVGGNTNAPTIMIAEKAADLIRTGARA
ncbi:MAG: glucose-methanol-choline oxidoreductase [Rubrivivax sp. SCN 70-15]|nr:MAG: glucose-methanol-choline oxidoreductase [Rubrivivax sp. SCN 70-15]